MTEILIVVSRLARIAARWTLFAVGLVFFLAALLARAAVEWALAGWDTGARLMSGDT